MILKEINGEIYFPRGSKELSFGSHNDNCTFDIILKVIQETKDNYMTQDVCVIF